MIDRNETQRADPPLTDRPDENSGVPLVQKDIFMISDNPSTAKPSPLEIPLPDPDKLPPELRDATWLTWRAEPASPGGKYRLGKIPCDASGRNVDSKSVKMTLSEALESAKQLRERNGPIYGVGVSFHHPCDFWILDLDNELAESRSQRLDWVMENAPTWAEVSVSGKGLHLVYQGEWRINRKATWRGRKAEVFGAKGFVAITGEHWADSPSELNEGLRLHVELSRLLEPELWGGAAPDSNGGDSLPCGSSIPDDDELIDRAKKAKNGEKFARLWDGDISDHGGDESAADLALCNMLAFWTGPNPERINRLFRQSGLYRDKWDKRHSSDGHTYGEMTVGKSLEGRTEFFGSEKQPQGVGAKDREKWPEPLYPDELTDDCELEYLWDGIIARGHVTMLSALMKAGKSTLFGHLISCLQRGEKFLGRYTKETNVLVVSEESKAIWRMRRDSLALDRHVSLLCRPMKAKPTPADWVEFIRYVAAEAKKRKCGLIVFDTISAFAPWKNENDAAEVQQALTPLTALAESGPAVLLFHHMGKAGGSEGRAARGSTALTGMVDVMMELRRFHPEDSSNRRRIINALGRFDNLPDELVIELAPDGKSYTAVGSRQEVRAEGLIRAIQDILPDKSPGMKAIEVHALLPVGNRPKLGDLRRILNDGAEKSHWQRVGEGKGNSAWRFWRPQEGN